TTKKDKKSFNQSLAEWKLFIYNRTAGEFLGRTAKNWGLSLLFYIVFYGFLAAVFSFIVWAMLQTLNDEVPKYCHRIPSPGLTPYVLEEQKNLTDCTNGNFFEQKGPEYTACQFPLALLEACSGVDDPTFGCHAGNPCILVKMSKIIVLKRHGEPRIDCIAKSESTAVLSSYPPNEKIDLKYFPYCGKKLHGSNLQPLVAVHLSFGSDGDVKENDHDKFSGRVTFKITMHA
uniref:Sodium/potassium-transporting ATPase subunit beta-3 n=1 Tax=Moschus moschiferus TaxID=68415 RepID=A0A8C6FXN6_MOSMO